MEMLGKVRRMYYRDGLSRSEISRRTGLSRNTVKKWLKAAEGASPAYRRESTPGKGIPASAPEKRTSARRKSATLKTRAQRP